MRPVYLEMNAFGSYKHCELDFELLGKEGLYLITGKTGSGKTTIFDAITYALYGELSGNERKKNMMISQYAEKGSCTSVKLIFELFGEKYTITRSSGREGVRLLYPDGRTLDGKEVKEEICSLLGMTREQFKQIMMLAQGDFRELLTAKAEDRKAIFRKIFGTELDNRFQTILKEKAKELTDTLALEKERTLSIVKTVCCDEGSGIHEKQSRLLENALANVETLGEFAKLLSELVDEEKETRNKLLEENKALDAKLTELTKQIENGSRRDELLQRIDELNKGLPELESAVEQLKRTADEVKSANSPMIKKLNEEDIPKLKNSYPEYEKRDNLREETERLSNCISENQADKYKKETECKRLSAQLEKDKSELETLKSADVNIANLNSLIDKLNLRKSDLAALENAVKTLNSDRERHQAAALEYDKANAERERLNNKSEELYTLFWNEQAGIIASEKLKEGEPCPVCGSARHPRIAVKSENAPTKAEVDSSRKQAEKAQADFERKGRISAELKTKAQSAERAVAERIAALSLDCSTDQAAAVARAELERVDGEMAELTERRKSEEAKCKRRQILETEIPKTESRISELNQRINTLKEQIAADRSTLEEKGNRLDALAKLEFDTKAEAEREVGRLQRNAAELESQIMNAQNAADDKAKQLDEVNTTIKAYSENVKGMTIYDVEELRNEQSKLAEDRNEIGDRLTDLGMSLRMNEQASDKLGKGFKALAELERKCDDYTVLSRIANTEKGSMIDFESYVQSVYFEKVLYHANVHFSTMSNGQFELIRKESGDGRKNSVLDMDVMDSHTGLPRDVNSLSGGEKFMASLSLALGLSEAVREYSGGVRLETMFIDEGFGSLDGEKLDEAMCVLNSLADGRLIGIISHVETIKNEVQRKIIVTKSDKNGSAAVIEA